MSKLGLIGALSVLAVLSSATLVRALPAFPGAEGWGSDNVGGRNGEIIFVTTLEDDGSQGSLRWALTQRYPRTVLFRVSGNIMLSGDVMVGVWPPLPKEPPYGGEDFSYLTVDGSSAPGGGVCISGAGILLGGGVHDVIFRNLRFRQKPAGSSFIGVQGGSHDMIIDHCSVSWCGDQQISVGHAQPVAMTEGFTTDVTISNCIIAEALMYYGEAQGVLLAHGEDRISIHHSFLTGNPDRNPKMVGGMSTVGMGEESRNVYVLHPVFDLRNNVIYNWMGFASTLDYGSCANIVSSVYKNGPDRTGTSAAIIITDYERKPGYPVDLGTKLYLDDNVAPTTVANPTQWDIVFTRGFGKYPEVFRADTPFPAPPVTTISSELVPDLVLSTVGAFPRDETDARFVQEYWDGTGDCGAMKSGRNNDFPLPILAPGTPPLDTDLDGMPDSWEEAAGLNPEDASDAWQDRDGDGYPNLEEYLHCALETKLSPGALDAD